MGRGILHHDLFNSHKTQNLSNSHLTHEHIIIVEESNMANKSTEQNILCSRG